MTLTINGCIKSTTSTEVLLGECRVEVFFEQKLKEGPAGRRLNAGRDSSGAAAPGSLNLAGRGRESARTNMKGCFTVRIPSEADLVSEILIFQVSGPAGQLIGEAKVSVSKATDRLIIPVDAGSLAPIPLAAPEIPHREKTRRVSGRVLDRNGRSVRGNTQVLLFAHRAGDDGPATGNTPVLVARTDGSGYFFGELPNEEYERASALIAGVAGEVPVVLDDGYIPRKLILLIDLPDGADTDAAGGGCGVIPRTPSHSDIDNSPDTYSTDLGTGRCVEFNTPNRAIEEFDFFTVVRTTEPDIVGFVSGGASSSAGSAQPDDTLATLSAAAAAAESVAAAAAKAAEEAALAVTQAQAGIAEAQALKAAYAAFSGNPNSRVRLAVEGALGDKGTANWSESGVRDRLIDALVNSEGIAPPVALKIAEDLLDAIIAVPDTELHDPNYSGTLPLAYHVASQIVYAAAQAAQTADRVAATKVSAAIATATAASIRAAEARRDAEAARALETAKKNEIAVRAQAQAWKDQNKPRGRERLSARNPVDWDETPTFYQAAEIAHGHLLHFKQVWYADGYSLGDLLYSLPLAPGQKKLISVIDWERRERADRAEDAVSQEGLNAALSRDRDLSEVVTGALTEMSRGGSRNTTAGIGVGTGAAGNGSYQGFNFGALLGISGGYGESNSSAWQDSARNLSSNSIQNLRDRTLQSASAIRSLRSTVVHTVAQGEALRATTEVVANHNHCHAMTVQYFEVLRHLKLQHELAGVQECLFVPLPMSAFDIPKALRWRQELKAYLQKPQLAGGFDAARRVNTQWSQVDSPLGRYADEHVLSLTGELLITIHIPLPPFPERPKPGPGDSAANIAQALADAVNPTAGPLGILLAIVTGGASLAGGAATSAVINASREAAKGARAIADELYAEASPQERYNRFHRNIAPGVIESFIDQLELWATVGSSTVRLNGVDFTLASEYQPGVPLQVSLRATLSGQMRRADISQLMIKSPNGLPTSFRAIVNTAKIRYRTSTFDRSLVDDSKVNDDIDPPRAVAVFTGLFDFEIRSLSQGTGATLYTPIDAWEQKSPRTEDRRLAHELIEHLNDNLEYYHHAIWWAMDPNRRYMLLDGYYAPGSDNRSVASVVENRLIGIVGNSIILPVSPGVHLDPRFRPDEEGDVAELQDFYRLATPMTATRISLPTRGVFAEAVMGACNSCEKIDDSRFWHWEESPIDEPPSIEPISTASRRSEPATTQPSQFPAPMVSIQNAPAAPDPVGVRAALEALGKQSFADITGLAGTQANAAAAYSQALDTAFKFGKEASTLAQQAAMLKSIDKSMDAIDKAEAEGKIDSSEAKKLRTTALEKLIGQSNGKMTPGDVAERVKLIDELKASNSISSGDAQSLNKTALRSLVDGNQPARDDQAAAAGLVGELDPENVASITTGDGPTIVRTGLDDSEQRRAPTHIRGLSGLGGTSGEGSSTTNQLWSGAKSLFEAVADGVVNWKDAPHQDLGDAVIDSIRSAAISAADDATDKIPLVKAIKIGVQLSLVFADGVGEALTRTNERLARSYRAAEYAGSGSDGLSDEDVAAIQNVRRWQLNSINEINGILLNGIAAVVEQVMAKALTWLSATAVKTTSNVAKQLIEHYLNQSGAQAMLATALSDMKSGIPLERQAFYREVVTTVVGLYVRQLDNAALRADLAPLTKLGGNKPLEKMMLGTLASLLVDPVSRRINTGLRKLIAAKARAIVLELRSSGQTVESGPVLGASDGGVVLPRIALIEIENGSEAAESVAEKEASELRVTLEQLQAGARTLAITLGRMRQRGLVQSKQREDDEAFWSIWNGYTDEITKIFIELHQASMYAFAELDSNAQEKARVWLLGILKLPMLSRDDPAKWKIVGFNTETKLIQSSYPVTEL